MCQLVVEMNDYHYLKEYLHASVTTKVTRSHAHAHTRTHTHIHIHTIPFIPLALAELPHVAKETRGFDAAAGCTIPQRRKEGAKDYRFFPGTYKSVWAHPRRCRCRCRYTSLNMYRNVVAGAGVQVQVQMSVY